MSMKKAFFSALAILTINQSAHSTTMSLAAGTAPSFGVFESTNTSLVANGSLIRTGYLATANDPTSFVEFGTGQVRTVGIGVNARPGRIAGSVTPTLADESLHNSFNNKTIYLWVYSTAGANLTADQGLFATNKAFPQNDTQGVGDDVTVISNTDIVGVLAAPGFSAPQILAQAGDANSPTHFVLGSVPEPSSTLFLSALFGAFIYRRRR